MWVFSSGWMDEVIATPWVKSTFAAPVTLRYRRLSVCAPTSASELVRVSSPNLPEIYGS